MVLICERPYLAAVNVGMLARKQGQYTRPIIGSIVDVRIEDFADDSVLHSKHASNYIGRLPDIEEIGQHGRYFLSSPNFANRTDLTAADVKPLLQSGKYIMLPDDWYEYAMVVDDYNGYIKAPKVNRDNEPSAEEIDERLDEFESNRGRLRVYSPQTIAKWQTESYIERLNRIKVLRSDGL